MRKFAMVVGALLALTVAAHPQPVVQNQVSGNETWSVGQGPGGPSSFLNIGATSNRAAITTVSATSPVTTTMTRAQSTVIWISTGAPAQWNIVLPSPAYDGQIVTVASGIPITSGVSVTAGTGQTLNNTFVAQTISQTSSAEFQFVNSLLKWYRIR